MLDENDDKPRRNLMMISLLLIVFALAGGTVTGKGTFGIFFISLSRPAAIEYTALALFVYFWWSYWITHKGHLKVFLDRIKTALKHQKEYREFLADTYNAEANGDQYYDMAIETQVQRHLVHTNNRPLPEKDGFLEWRVKERNLVEVRAVDRNISINIGINRRINPDLLMTLWLRIFFNEILTNTAFRDNILPYAMGVTALVVTIF